MDLRNELLGVMDPAVSFETNLQTLRALKQHGATAEEVQTALEAMFQESHDECVQEGIADLLDCVVGWCNPKYAVWRA